jgi:sugar/nucleoside kinase (ribokinase family)
MKPRAWRPRVVCVGDLVVDVVLAPSIELVAGTDVPGRVMLRQGGSATTTARWLGRSGARAGLVAAVGRDAAGRALVREIESDGVLPRVARVAGHPTGRVGVFVAPGGERSFVQDRGAALRLAPEHLHPAWFAAADLVHVPAYSLLDHPLGDAGRRAAELAHAAGALVSVDLSSSAPLLAAGRESAAALVRGARPDLLFANDSEVAALGPGAEALLAFAPVVVQKRGSGGATVLLREGESVRRIEVPARPVVADDTTGAGDAFDAGFILGWLRARHANATPAAAARAGAASGNSLAARHLGRPRRELALD